MMNGNRDMNPRYTHVPELNLNQDERNYLKSYFMDGYKVTLKNFTQIPNQPNPIFYWLETKDYIINYYVELLQDIMKINESKTIFVVQKPGENLRPHIDMESQDRHMRVCLFNFPLFLPCDIPTDWYEGTEKVADRWFEEDKNKIIDKTYYNNGETVLLNTKYVHGANNKSSNWRIFFQVTFDEVYEKGVERYLQWINK